jgi:hypothetical protein
MTPKKNLVRRNPKREVERRKGLHRKSVIVVIVANRREWEGRFWLV